MKYTIEQLNTLIRPIISTAVKMDVDNDIKIDVTSNAILEIIRQDREAQND